MKSVVDRIKTLVDLRDQGSISKEEFDQMLALLEQELHRENKDASALNADRAPQNIERKHKRNKGIILGSASGVLVLFVLSFFTMVPAFLWDSDGDGFHNYRNDNCPAVSGTCQGCLDSDNDGFADSEDECSKESSTTCKGCPDSDNDGVADKADSCLNEPGISNCSGCPDRDSDGVSDSLDQCPEEKGLKINQGCPETQAPPTIDDTQKLQNGEAVKVPSAFGNYVVTKKWLRLKNNGYEYSEYEKRAYKPVNTKETVEKLNAFYGLQIPISQENPKPPKGPVGPKHPKVPEPEDFNLSAEIIHKKLNFSADFGINANDIYYDLVKGKIPNVSIVSIVEEPTKNSINEITTVVLKIKIGSTKYRATFIQEGLKLQNDSNNNHVVAVWNNRDLTTRPTSAAEKKRIKSDDRLEYWVDVLGGDKFIFQKE